MRKNRYLVLAVALALGAWGCDNNDGEDAGTDAGPTGADAGTDAGPMVEMDGGADAGVDSGMDAGTMPTFEVRLVNNLPGIVDGTGEPMGLHVCNFLSFMGSPIPPGMLETQTLGPLPFPGVSPRITRPVSEYFIAFYAADALGSPASCPSDPMAATAPPAVLTAVVPQDMLPDGAQISLIVSGLAPDTFGATGGSLPAICNPSGAPTFMELCAQGAQLLVVPDDGTRPAAGMTRFRVSNQVVNSTPPSGFTVCYDPGLIPNPSGDGSCIDTTPGMSDETALAPNVTYGTVTDYADRSAITATGVPSADVGGGLYLELETGSGCPDFASAASTACYPILTGAAAAAAGAGRPGNLRFELSADALNTIFIFGAIGLGPRDPGADFGPSFFIWQDDFGATP